MFWRRNREQRNTEFWARIMHPPITMAEREAALARKAVEDAKHAFVDFGDGQGAVKVATGVAFFEDMPRIYGYGVVQVGYDRWGWPMGSSDSPDARNPSPSSPT